MLRTIYITFVVSLAGVLCENAKSTLNLESKPRITNAPDAHKGQFPWHALLAIQYQNDHTNRIIFCNGAILNELWIITTADCIFNARTIRVEIGTVKLSTLAITVYPNLFIIHPQYNADRLRNNLALLRLPLNRPLHFSSELNPDFYPVRLPSLRQSNESFRGQEAFFTGFGYTSFSSKNISEYLFYSSQTVISNKDCVWHYDGDTELVSSGIVCTLSFVVRESPCMGDGGAPLVINEFGSWTLIGILSFLHRDSCGRNYAPTAFTRLTSHLDWISRTAHYQLRP